jgi:hypothetical protein
MTSVSESYRAKNDRKGYFWVPDEFIRQLRCNVFVKGLCMVLYSHANESGESFPGIVLIASEAGMSKTQTRRAAKEGEQLGLFVVQRVKGSVNRYKLLDPMFWSCESVVAPKANDTASRESPVAPKNDEPTPGESALPRPVRAPKEYPSKEYPNKKDRLLVPDGFDRFWDLWPVDYKVNRKKALQEWESIDPDDALVQHILAALKIQKQSKPWARSIGIPHPANWIRDERWLDNRGASDNGAEKAKGNIGSEQHQVNKGAEASNHSVSSPLCHRPGWGYFRMIDGNKVPVPDNEVSEEIRRKVAPKQNGDVGRGPNQQPLLEDLVGKMSMPLGLTDRRRKR